MKEAAKQIFLAGVQAVEPANAVSQFVRLTGWELCVHDRAYDLRHFRGVTVVGAGKAAAPMAAALEEILDPYLLAGLINVKYQHTQRLKKIRIQEAGHPIPDENGLRGAQEILKLVQPLAEHDLVFCVISGGGSALLPLPAAGLTLADKQETTRLLLACGADIEEVNTVRKHLSGIKGGLLARAAAPALLISLVLSDVIGDRLDAIASGPTVPDATTFLEVGEILQRYHLSTRLPGDVLRHLMHGLTGRVAETPKAGDPAFARTQNVIVGSNRLAIQAAAAKAQALGYRPLILSTCIEGETREIARAHAAIAKEVLLAGHPIPPPACILSGGETTVTLSGQGLGGRNQEFALAMAIDLAGLPHTLALSAGTDGSDGPTDAAGAFADGTTLERAAAKNLNAADFLRRNDSYNFFAPIGDLLVTGPTKTNVMDLRILLVGTPAPALHDRRL